MKALSIKQPWAWAIIDDGKDIENRKWPTSFRGSFLIHASKGYDKTAPAELQKKWFEAFDRGDSTAQFGGVIGIAELSDCVNKSDSQWFDGPYGFVLKHAKKMPFIKYKGQLRLFEVKL